MTIVCERVRSRLFLRLHLTQVIVCVSTASSWLTATLVVADGTGSQAALWLCLL